MSLQWISTSASISGSPAGAARSARRSASRTASLLALALTTVGACTTSDDDDVDGGGGGGGGGPSGGDAQTPPTRGAELEAWLAQGHYKRWSGEPAVHPARPPGAHGANRIFANDAMAAAAGERGPWPRGAASVKELYASAAATTPIGYAVSLKLDDDSAGGAGWYWYERYAGSSGSFQVVADGRGDAGAAKPVRRLPSSGGPRRGKHADAGSSRSGLHAGTAAIALGQQGRTPPAPHARARRPRAPAAHAGHARRPRRNRA